MPHKKQQRLYCELSVLAAVSKLAEDKGMTTDTSTILNHKKHPKDA